MQGIFAILIALALAMLPPPASAAAGDVLVLAYHNVHAQKPAAAEGISTDQLIQQFNWLEQHGYHPVSVDTLVAAAAGRKKLPDKAVLLTFDDGYANFYTEVFPLLKSFHYPAVVAVVGTWVGTKGFMNWTQLETLSRSGLVELASHTYDLHKGVVANPQGNLEPAVVTQRYDAASGRYESSASHAARLRADSRRMVDLIRQHTGRAPRVMVWPYGATDAQASAIAAKDGMRITLGLHDGIGKLDSLHYLPRFFMPGDIRLSRFAEYIERLGITRAVRALHLDLNDVYAEDPAEQEQRLSALIDTVYKHAANVVYLRVYADEHAMAGAVYFPNRYLPMRADLLNRAAWQLRTRTRARIIAVLPSSTLPEHAREGIYADLHHNAPLVEIQRTADTP